MLSNEKISFEHKGIGEVLQQNFLEVPLNQREYSWEREHVEELFQDYIDAIDNRQGIHFLGTIVLTKVSGDIPEVSDGQQRLSTTTILLAAVRDYCVRNGDASRADTIAHSYLISNDLETTDAVPKLQLNVDDRQFFTNFVLLHPEDQKRKNAVATQESHRKIKSACAIASEFVRKVLEPHADEHKIRRLLEIVRFIKQGAQVIVLRVPDHMNAFTMFETLNDRGLKASQADLLKNHLLSYAGSRIKEAQQYWAKMVGILDTLGIEDVAVTFLHHVLITKHGPVRASDVFDKVKQTVNTQNRALDFLQELADSANDYAALFNPDNKKWNDYGTSTRKHISTINRDLRVTQIRPLMFAVSKNFSLVEARKAFKCFVCWSVRLLITGVHGGVLERSYALRAHDVGSGRITTSAELYRALNDIIPTDAAFEASFREARVSQERLGRYYLRSLEREKKGEAEPEFLPSDEEQSVNLEHILPERPQNNWPSIDSETANTYFKRIGNMALLPAKKNSIIGNMSFLDKKPALATSEFVLTSNVADYDDWGPEQIEARQREMAILAVKTWPLT